jgi:hypothetical protein
MKSSFKNTLILLFQRIDKAIFDVHRTSSAWKSKKLPHWVVFILVLGLYFLLIWQLWPFLSASEIPSLKYFGFFMVLVFTILFLVLAKIYISQLINYQSSYSIQNLKTPLRDNNRGLDTPFRVSPMTNKIDYENAGLFKDYLKTNREDFLKLLSGKQISEKLVWLPLTDRKLPNFRLFFEFLNHISEENIEGYYGENLILLCNYITSNFKSKDKEWTVKQLQKAHSGWKNCNPKRRMDLKIDIENHLVFLGKS